MGYTHYWHINDPARLQAVMPAIVADVTRILEHVEVPVQFESDDVCPPYVTEGLIRFNGVGEDGHETFYFYPKEGGSFCKTERKPYDLVVTSVLRRIAHHAGDAVEVTSDGVTAPDVYPANYVPGALTMEQVRKRYGEEWAPADRVISELFSEPATVNV